MPERLTRSGLRGYPLRYRESVRRWWIGGARVVAVLGAAASALVYLAVCGSMPVRLAAVAGAIFLYALLVVIAEGLSHVSVVLYFEREVPGGWYTDSAAIARNCVYLDEIAARAGVSTLSAFGFADDMGGETVTWHAPELGLLTISRLSEKLRENPGFEPEAGNILADLDKMRARLEEARKQGTRFCLILHGNAINSMEVEQRKGRF